MYTHLFPIFLFAFFLFACEKNNTPSSEVPSLHREVTLPSAIQFTEISAQSGIEWQHDNGASANKYFPETMSGGGAFIDYDRDGDLDIYALNGGELTVDQSMRPPNALFRNEGGHFVERGAQLGVDDRGYGMGVAAGDIDGDDDIDMYLTNYGTNVMLRNDGTNFTNTSIASGTADSLWGSSAAFADYDRDGDLDLYVANYVLYSLEDAHIDNIPYMAGLDSYKGTVEKGYPHPANFPGSPDRLFRNDGNGTFTEVAKQAGIFDHSGKGLGVVFADYDKDGWPDIYVANDAVRNFLYRNMGNATFIEGAGLSGVAYGLDGQMEAGMGVDWGDYDDDGQLDLTVTNFQAEPNALYHNEDGQFFSVETFTSGTGMISLPFLGFGTHFFDYDHDGDLDLFTANGHVLDNIDRIDHSTQYRQRNLLFRNDGNQQIEGVRFNEVGVESGLTLENTSRGTAIGDCDNDGDVDILVFNVGQKLSLLRNDGGEQAGSWLWVNLVGRKSNSDGIGARLILSAQGKLQTREMRGSRSYLSQSDLRVHFGLGAAQEIDWLEIHWPSGHVERFRDISLNTSLILSEGTGEPID